ncbi:hypothetical protein Zmor_000114 [Zophobas morio]|uniref:Uncharacterized protein n=1 Tax=Zophobas morio TaxID=2755281 RepID=A0AA38J218_9CUCU|nr:hypothetical protein Zmor_000114 [Zophobas morio]
MSESDPVASNNADDEAEECQSGTSDKPEMVMRLFWRVNATLCWALFVGDLWVEIEMTADGRAMGAMRKRMIVEDKKYRYFSEKYDEDWFLCEGVGESSSRSDVLKIEQKIYPDKTFFYPKFCLRK